MRLRELHETDAETGATAAVAAAAGTNLALHVLTDAEVKAKLFTSSGGKVLLTTFASMLWKRFAVPLLFGIGAVYSLFQAYEAWREGDWRSALAQLASAGLNVLELTGLISGGAGTVASLTAQLAAQLYANRWAIFPIWYADPQTGKLATFDKTDEQHEQLADVMCEQIAKALIDWVWDELTAFVEYLRSWLPSNWGSSNSSNAKVTSQTQTAQTAAKPYVVPAEFSRMLPPV